MILLDLFHPPLTDFWIFEYRDDDDDDDDDDALYCKHLVHPGYAINF